jgi:hypothetical protein
VVLGITSFCSAERCPAHIPHPNGTEEDGAFQCHHQACGIDIGRIALKLGLAPVEKAAPNGLADLSNMDYEPSSPKPVRNTALPSVCFCNIWTGTSAS